MNVLIVGQGGREHALAWKVAQSPLVSRVFVAPGNAGTALEPGVENIAIDVTDISGLCTFALANNVGLTIVGPETPLVDGIVDTFQTYDLPCFGPSQAASALEGSKAFCKDFLQHHHIPTAAYAVFEEDETDEAKAYILSQPLPIVIKADGLAAGKGVVIADTHESACAVVDDFLQDGHLGDAGRRLVIEAFLAGEELSYIVLTDGMTAIPLASAQDHKARDDGDQGPNTGGMGAYSPAPVLTEELSARVLKDIIYPTLEGMRADGHPFVGFLYAGLMIMPNGEPMVLEYNCRLGDPETQPLMMRLKSDLVELCLSALNGHLPEQEIKWDPRVALGVVLAARGYPATAETGVPIPTVRTSTTEAKVFHAGTTLKNGQAVSSGGRVLCATALGDSYSDAQQKAYALVEEAAFDGCHYRRDIGYRAIRRES
ncbi:MAG: phosphoribosylamine--glycine ligase [Pseudomonadota bacterium]